MSKLPRWQRALIALSGTVIAVVVVGTLYWAQAVFIPIAMAIFLAFLLSPPVRWLQRRGLPRLAAVLAVVILTTAFVIGFGWLVLKQANSLISDLPRYTANVKTKIKAARELVAGSEKLNKMLKEVGGELNGKKNLPEHAVEKPTPVVVQPESPSWLVTLPDYLGSAAQFAAELGLALALVLFILLATNDLRNRFLRIMHRGRLSLTTKALDESGHRISRYLLTQAFLNACFGLCIGVGLAVIGVDYALLWGLIAALSRYIPYVGPWLAAIFPITMSLAMFEGWWQLVAVTLLFTVLDLSANNLVEPLLYGHSVGISAVALLVCAAIWAFLWGPIGLVLSAPITVVLMVLGRHFPQLKFFDILLGDQPALHPSLSYYQRLLAHDKDGAEELVLEQLKTVPRERIYDELLAPSLTYSRRDRRHGEISKDEEDFVLQANAEILQHLGERLDTLPVQDATTPEAGTEPPQRLHLVGCPADGEADRLGLLMLAQALERTKWDVEILGVDLLSAERVAQAGAENPAVVCIGSVAPGGLARTRYLCKRLRHLFPQVHIFVGRWGQQDEDEDVEALRESGANEITRTLLETQHQLAAWRPVFMAQQPQNAATESPADELLSELAQPARGRKGAGKFERLQSLVVEKKSS